MPGWEKIQHKGLETLLERTLGRCKEVKEESYEAQNICKRRKLIRGHGLVGINKSFFFPSNFVKTQIISTPEYKLAGTTLNSGAVPRSIFTFKNSASCSPSTVLPDLTFVHVLSY